jgi:hypothetical protein
MDRRSQLVEAPMARKWSDLSPDEALKHRQRIDRALEGYQETVEDLARRRAESRQHASASPRVVTPPKPASATVEPLAHPVQRSAGAPRDWTAEQRWVELIIDAKLAPWPDGIGEALGEERRALRQEFEAKLATVKAELVRDFTQRIEDMRASFRTALAGDEDQLMKRLERIDALIDRWSRVDLALRDPKYTIDVRPN